MKIILGSASPRRRDILRTIIPEFEVISPDCDESPEKNESPEHFTGRVSRDKLESVLSILNIGNIPSLIITSDTIVAIDGLILGKPADYDDAVKKLALLNGRTHRVITGMTMMVTGRNGSMRDRILTGIEITSVTFKKLDRRKIEEYLDSIDYCDKAGAYAFQEQGSMIIDCVSGSVTNIIGFPLRLFFSMVISLGAEELFTDRYPSN